MASATTRPTRIHNDIVTTAASVAATEDRTATEQVNHWARIGMQIERSATMNWRRIRSAATGHTQFNELAAAERSTAHALIDAQIGTRVAGQSFGAAARATGQRTVSIDDDGQLIEIHADGTQRRL